MDEFEHIGEWWLPDRPDRRRGGVLRFSRKDGLRLTLIGRLEDDGVDSPAGDHPIVLGHAPGLGAVTLRTCWWSGETASDVRGLPTLAVPEYGVDTAFLGAHFHAGEDLRFRGVDAAFSGLLDWVGPPQFVWSRGPGDQDRSETVSYRRPDEISGRFGRTRIAIWPQLRRRRGHGEASLKHDYRVAFESAEPWTVGEWLAHAIGPFQDLLSFAMGAPSVVRDLPAHVLHAEGMPTDSVRVVMRMMRGEGEGEPDYGRSAMLFAYSDVADRFEEVLTAWNGLYGAIDSVIHLYLGTLYRKGRFPYTEAEFLTMVQAVESYHQRRRSGLVIAKADHEARLTEILAAVPDAHREWLEQRLVRSNEKSLLQRLRELGSETDRVLAGTVPDREAFFASVRDTRHFFTHFSKGLEKKRLRDAELLNATQILAVMLDALVLRELGFADGEAVERVRGTERYRTIGQWEAVSIDSD